ncbi:hypothetical protein PQX77_002922 [Marasmius sp. AFHP31]|nr:hypothetical protein PQX77_002922 [Marasmius sp. AFHP31]
MSTVDDVGDKAKWFEKILDDYIKGKLDGVTSLAELGRTLREAGATIDEARDYVSQAQAHPTISSPVPRRQPTPEGLSQQALAEFRKEREQKEADQRQKADEERIRLDDERKRAAEE